MGQGLLSDEGEVRERPALELKRMGVPAVELPELLEEAPDFDAETAAFYTLTAPYPATLKDAVKESPKKFERIAKKLQAAAYNERLDLLFAHYGIDPTKPNAWRDLTVALAKRYVPGFQPPQSQPVLLRNGTTFDT